MSSVLSEISNFEKELSLLDGILQNILLFDTTENELAVNFRFDCSQDYDSSVIGGLTASINEFVGVVDGISPRIIELQYLKLIFTTYHGVLSVFAVDPSYGVEQYQATLNYFCKIIDNLMEETEKDFTVKDDLAIAAQTLQSLLSEDLPLELKIGEKVGIYPFRMREIADKKAEDLIGMSTSDLTPAVAPADSGKVVSQNDLDQINVNLDELSNYEDSEEKNKAIYELLAKFSNTFSDCLQLTLLRFPDNGHIEKITAGRLQSLIEEDMYDTIIGLLDTVVALLDGSEEMRTIDLDDRWVYFQIISPNAFMYLVINNLDVLDLIRPLIERISQTIADLFPD